MTSHWRSSLALFLFLTASSARADFVEVAAETIRSYVPSESAGVRNCVSKITAQWIGEGPPKTTKTCNRRQRRRGLDANEAKFYPYRVILKYRAAEMYDNKTVIVYSGQSALAENCLEDYLHRKIRPIEDALADIMCSRFEGSGRLQFAELPAPQIRYRGTVAR